MAGICKQRTSSGKCRAWFTDWQGKQVFFTGTTNPKETERMAERHEDHHRRIKLGDLPLPKSSDTPRTFAEVSAAYLAWGRSQGGIGGRLWSTEHAEKREYGLKWWGERLGLATMRDLDDVLPRVEETLREFQATGKANLTVEHRATCLTTFCAWCVKRGFLNSDPLRGMVSYDKTAKYSRRALTADEIQRLLNSCCPAHRLTYQAALSSGLRANELRSLAVVDLDVERGGLRLNPNWTKNKRPGFQPLPAFLVALLQEAAQGKAPDAALLNVGQHTARDLDADLRRANIPKTAPGGKVDFHALRVAFTTFVIEAGANIKEAQTLVRHATPALTMNTYARARNDRLAEVAEKVAKVINSGQKYEHSMHKLAAGAEGLILNDDGETGCRIVAAGRFDSDAPPPHDIGF